MAEPQRVRSDHPLQIVLIADDSGSMSGEPAESVTEGIRNFVTILQTFGKGEKNYFKLLFVKFGETPEVVHEFTPILDVDSNEIELSGNSGSTNMDLALELVADKMDANRPQSELDVAPLVLLWSDGQNTGGDPLPAASRIKSMQCPCGQSPLFVTCGFGDADRGTLEALATSAEHYKELKSVEELVAFLGKVGGSLTAKGQSIDGVREEMKAL